MNNEYIFINGIKSIIMGASLKCTVALYITLKD